MNEELNEISSHKSNQHPIRYINVQIYVYIGQINLNENEKNNKNNYANTLRWFETVFKTENENQDWRAGEPENQLDFVMDFYECSYNLIVFAYNPYSLHS